MVTNPGLGTCKGVLEVALYLSANPWGPVFPRDPWGPVFPRDPWGPSWPVRFRYQKL